MKTGRSLQSLAEELERQRHLKRDFIVASDSMELEEGAELFSLRRPLESGMREVTPYTMTDLFHRQLGAALGIPAKYYDKMREDYPALLRQNVNGWLRRMQSKHTIRTMGGTVRAMLSDRYRRIDNFEVANATLPVISKMPDARVESCEITETRMYIKVVNPRLKTEVQPGDMVQAGVIISNSEVGLGSVRVMPLVYRLVCRNGMIVNDLGQRRYHVGRELEESWELFSDETMQAEDTAFLLKLADVVRAAVDEARFGMVVDRLREAAKIRITAPVTEVVELTAQRFGLTKSEEVGILQHLIEGGDLSQYGLSNAVTRASQDVESYDRATALEGVGWQIASMSRDQWSGIHEARP